MANLITLARPYAKAIFAIAEQDNACAVWEQALLKLKECLQDNKLKTILLHPFVSDAEKASCLLACVSGVKEVPPLKAFIAIMLEHKRIELLPFISELFVELRQQQQGAIAVELISAEKVAAKEEKTVLAILEKNLQRKVEMQIRVEPELIAGARLKIEDQVIDGSIAGRIQQLAASLGLET